MRDVFESGKERPQFAGHETFPLRLLWLKKAFEAVKDGAPTATFYDPSAIANFGVGRNMAVAMRYWGLATGFIEEEGRELRPTDLGRLVLGDDGLDPYVERAATTWLAHWHVASNSRLTTTTYYAFNGLAAFEFDPATLVDEIMASVEANRWRASRVTIKRDVDVFLRSYVRRDDVAVEDAAEPLLAELGLVREARVGGWYEFVRGPKPSLSNGVFAYALSEFWRTRVDGATAITAEQVCYAPGSPGRVFKLDEDSVVTRLMALEDITSGSWLWTDTAGLRQMQKVGEIDPFALVSQGYPARRSVVAQPT